MRVIGTAGHVDHGKSTLVEALTGIHPDRLKEERDREMTIDLGFAWLTLPDDEEVGIIDVPGHRDFIENMLAGVGGIDAVLFVIASDEGVMPQTREHLAILDLLEVKTGLVVLTKIDMVADPDWLDLVEDDIRQVLKGTFLEDAPIVRVSARSRSGISVLISELARCLQDTPTRVNLGKPRLPVDRIFSVPGFGTVVTGTLCDGSLQVGDELVILPAGISGRIRGLQTHKKKEDVAVAGSRTAVNISGVALEQINRGDLLTHPGDYKVTSRMDVRFQHLKDATLSIKHNTEVKIYIGAAEVLARLRLLGTEEVLPGDQAWLQLELKEPVVAVRGDRFILRRPSPGETIGGGIVIDPFPKKRHKRFANEVIEQLQALEEGTPKEILLQAIRVSGVAPIKEIIARSSLDAQVAKQAFVEMQMNSEVILFDMELSQIIFSPDMYAADVNYWLQLSNKILKEVEKYHQGYPLRRGMPREELKSKLNLTPKIFQVVVRRLVSNSELVENGPLISRVGFTVQFSQSQQSTLDKVLAEISLTPYSPPSVKELQAALGDELYSAVLNQGKIIQVSPDVAFSQPGYENLLAELRQLIENNGTVTAAQFRDHLNTSRKYILAFLEHTDNIGITVRVGDARRLRK